jgi:hypothetical protein
MKEEEQNIKYKSEKETRRFKYGKIHRGVKIEEAI